MNTLGVFGSLLQLTKMYHDDPRWGYGIHLFKLNKSKLASAVAGVWARDLMIYNYPSYK